MARTSSVLVFLIFFQAEHGIRDIGVTGVQTCALPISAPLPAPRGPLTTALLAALARDPHRSLDLRHLLWEGEAAQACTDEDLQLALWLSYELHYRGQIGSVSSRESAMITVGAEILKKK